MALNAAPHKQNRVRSLVVRVGLSVVDELNDAVSNILLLTI
jgi:hypothetical protein